MFRGGSGGDNECQFFYKVGTCRHGSKCVRNHVVPKSSKAIVLVSMQQLFPTHAQKSREKAAAEIVRDLFIEVSLIAPIREMFMAANESPHLKGAVYISFASEQEAEKVITNINSRWFAERPIFAHYLPSQMLSMAVCREGERCQRKLDCNYAHPMQFGDAFWLELFAAQLKESECKVLSC